MTDYISREAAIKAISTAMGKVDRKIMRDRLMSIPAANVRPVVLCRDCKCYRQSSFVDKHMECARSGFPVHSVDFCSRGEKREES